MSIGLRLAGLAPFALLGLIYLVHDPFREVLNEGVACLLRGDREGLRDWAAARGAWAPLFTSLLMVAAAIAQPIPQVLVTATNSFLFGPFLGGLLSIASANVAAAACYWLARLLGEPIVVRLVRPETLARADELVRRHGPFAVFVARLLPFVPFDPISYVAGLARMPFWPFFWATLLGQIPAGMAYSYLAQEIDRPARLLVLTGAVLTALVLLGLTARRLLLARRPAGGLPSPKDESPRVKGKNAVSPDGRS